MNSSQVLISYNIEDHKEANIIGERLREVGINVIATELSPSQFEHVLQSINYRVNSNSYFILLLSQHSLKNEWTNIEINKILNNFYYRDVVIIPVILSNVKTPLALKTFKTFNLKNNFHHNLDELVNYLENIKYLDFNSLDAYGFHNLIADLLIKSKFKIEERAVRAFEEVDFLASSKNNNQLVGNFTTKWLVECKFYNSARIDVTSIKHISKQLKTDFPNHNGLLITNSILTSTALETLEIIENKNNVNIKVVDGWKLKQLLLKYPNLIRKHFIGREEA